jgi:hypothetical protein
MDYMQLLALALIVSTLLGVLFNWITALKNPFDRDVEYYKLFSNQSVDSNNIMPKYDEISRKEASKFHDPEASWYSSNWITTSKEKDKYCEYCGCKIDNTKVFCEQCGGPIK